MNVSIFGFLGLLLLFSLSVVVPLLVAKDLKRQGHELAPKLLVFFAGFMVFSWVSFFLTSSMGAKLPSQVPSGTPAKITAPTGTAPAKLVGAE